MKKTANIVVESQIDGISRIKLNEPSTYNALSSKMLESLINIFSALGIIPTKGMTLPFISYGGSSMISSSILFGFLLSLTKQKK